MAIRRMFSLRIANSARFLKMPISSQALYFHLGLHADDDGVVEAFNVLNNTGCTEDDLRVLAAKGFIKVLNEDLVSYITDWRENNYIRADRKMDSIYKDLLVSLNPEVDLLGKKERIDAKKKSMSDNGQTMDSLRTDNGQSMDGIGKDRIGEDRTGEVRVGEVKEKPERENRTRFVPPTLEQVTSYCSERQNNVDPQRFIDFYESKGWMVGKNKMKDWQAAVRTWEQRNKPTQNKAAEELNDFYAMMDRWAESEDT